jgi:hypothetical protein
MFSFKAISASKSTHADHPVIAEVVRTFVGRLDEVASSHHVQLHGRVAVGMLDYRTRSGLIRRTRP